MIREPKNPEYLRRRERPTADDYARAKWLTDMIKRSPTLTLQQKRTLYGQAVHGDIEGARKGYEVLTKIRGEG